MCSLQADKIVPGNPGTGKTILASSILRALETLDVTSDEPVNPVSYFFLYRHEVTRNPRTAWSLMLCRILDKYGGNPDILNAFSFAMNQSRQNYALGTELDGLYKLVAYRLPRLFLFLVGLAESNDPEDLAASVASVLHRTEAKAIVFSRPNFGVFQNHIERSLRHIHLTREKVDFDGRRLLQTRLGELGSGVFTASCPMSWVGSHLGDCANGMVLWAKLMVDYLALLPDAAAREKALRELTLHEELIDVYIRILKLISGRTSIERDMAKRVFLY